jgi:hypothetical protein
MPVQSFFVDGDDDETAAVRGHPVADGDRRMAVAIVATIAVVTAGSLYGADGGNGAYDGKRYGESRG